jgi:hypothetical protein
VSMSVPEVRTRDDIARLNGTVATVHGTYRALPRPMKGTLDEGPPNECAALELDDGTFVYLEPQDAAASARPVAELERFDGSPVAARGTIHKVMPSKGQSLINSCLADVAEIRETS